MKTMKRSAGKATVMVAVVAVALTWSQVSTADETVRFQRKIGNATSNLEVTCPKDAAANVETATCEIKSEGPAGKTTTSRIKLKKVREVLAQFFQTVPATEVRDAAEGRGPAYIPNNAALVYEIASGRQAAVGGATLDDIHGMQIAKKKVLESIAWLERQLTVFRE